MAVRATAFALALACVLFAHDALAQRNKFDGLRQCERHAAVQFRKDNPAFKRFMIDRATAREDKFADQVGTQFVSTIYHGKAMYEAGAGEKNFRFICLHAGYRRGPVFVYVMPE